MKKYLAILVIFWGCHQTEKVDSRRIPEPIYPMGTVSLSTSDSALMTNITIGPAVDLDSIRAMHLMGSGSTLSLVKHNIQMDDDTIVLPTRKPGDKSFTNYSDQKGSDTIVAIRDSFILSLLSTPGEGFYAGNTYIRPDPPVSTEHIRTLEQIDSMLNEIELNQNLLDSLERQYYADSVIIAFLTLVTGFKEDTIRDIDHVKVRGIFGIPYTLYNVPALIHRSWYGGEKYYFLDGETKCRVTRIYKK